MSKHRDIRAFMVRDRARKSKRETLHRAVKGTGNYRLVIRLESSETDLLLIEDLAEQAMEEFMTYLRDYDPGARLFEGEVTELKIGEKLTTKETGNDQEENQQR